MEVDLSSDIIIPKTYVIYKTHQSINIDGKADESDWNLVNFTDDFIDIEGVKTPKQKTHVKMLWDGDFLYIYAKLYEKHVWGNLKQRDTVIFHNNDFEVFISPSNNTHNYGEIEVNVLNTVWDLVLNKPYNVGGVPKNQWNLNKLRTAVFVKGSLNNPNDIDEYWSVEMAIPLQDLSELKRRAKRPPKDGEQWRINFSRVQWDHDLNNNVYSRKTKNNKLLPEYNWVWSNQGAINMHLPENWGYVQFSENTPANTIKFKHQTDILSEQMVYALYRKIAFKELKYLKDESLGTLLNFDPITIENNTMSGSFLKTHTGFTLSLKNLKTETIYTINETGLIHRNKI